MSQNIYIEDLIWLNARREQIGADCYDRARDIILKVTTAYGLATEEEARFLDALRRGDCSVCSDSFKTGPLIDFLFSDTGKELMSKVVNIILSK